MNKRFMALPIVGIVVAMLGSAVFASSPVPGVHPIEVSGNPSITTNDIIIIEGEDLKSVKGKKGTDLIDASTLQAEIDKQNSKLKAEDSEVVFTFGAYMTDDYANNGEHIDMHTIFPGSTPETIRISYSSSADDVIIVVHFEQSPGMGNGSWFIVGNADTTSSLKFTVPGLSPFAVIKVSPKSSSQTGEYAGTYIIMVATALVACGAVFAIRAKKESK